MRRAPRPSLLSQEIRVLGPQGFRRLRAFWGHHTALSHSSHEGHKTLIIEGSFDVHASICFAPKAPLDV